VPLRGHGRLLLASGPCADALPPDTAAWLVRGDADGLRPA
jgi:hypothetical protein